MESTVRTDPGAVDQSSRVGLLRAVYAIGALLMVGFVIYSAFVVSTTRSATFDGVFVTSVQLGSPALAAGVQANDVITQVNGMKVATTSQLSLAVVNSPGQNMTWVVDRGGSSVTLEIRPLTGIAPGDPSVGIQVHNKGTGQGRKARILNAVPVGISGMAILAVGLVVGMRRRRSDRGEGFLTD